MSVRNPRHRIFLRRTAALCRRWPRNPLPASSLPIEFTASMRCVPELAPAKTSANRPGPRSHFLRPAKFLDLAPSGVTQGPGLVGSLLVGITYAKPWPILGKPLVRQPSRSHVHAVFWKPTSRTSYPNFRGSASSSPVAHTVLFEARAEQELAPKPPPNSAIANIGQTRDDAAGEAYDKVSKLLGLGIRAAQSSIAWPQPRVPHPGRLNLAHQDERECARL